MEESKIFRIDETHEEWAARASKRYGGGKKKYLDFIVRQEGLCDFSGAKLIFDKRYCQLGKKEKGCHPLYAAIDHSAPGTTDQGFSVVCYALNDIKGHLPYDCFRALEGTRAWQEFMKAWKVEADNCLRDLNAFEAEVDTFKELRKRRLSGVTGEHMRKHVLILVPKTMTRVSGSSSSTRAREVGVDSVSILKALTTNDYHDNWYFPDPESVKVLSVEDSPEDAAGTT